MPHAFAGPRSTFDSMASNRYSVILGNLGNTCDRFLPTGYKAPVTTDDKLKLAASIPDIRGVELVGGWDVTTGNAGDIKSSLDRHGLACVSIIPDLFSRSIWGRGAFCSRDANVRQQ